MNNIVEVIKKGGLAILPTDTIYGIHALAGNTSAVDKIYEIKGRQFNKPLIVLLSKISQLNLFEINLDIKTKDTLDKVWPGKVSVVLPMNKDKFKYLHRGTNSLAFRIPDKENLRDLIEKTGPLVSTSANPEGRKPANTISQAKKYFRNQIDFYLDEGKLDSLPSTVIFIDKGKIKVLREGAVKIK